MKIGKQLTVLIFSVCAVFFSCTKTDETAGKDKAAMQDSENTAAAALQGVIYVHNTGLYTENDAGKMKWTAEAALGALPYYLGEKKEAERTDGQKRTFFHIELNGKKYWVQDYSYEPDTTPAFICAKDTILYKSESLTAVTDEILPLYLPVAVYNESLKDSGGKFVKIAAYSSELFSTWTVKEMFVKRDSVELFKNNVDAMYLALTAAESRNDTIRTELFQNALEMDSAYNYDIAELQTLTEIIIKEENFMKTLSPEKINEKIMVETDIDLLSIPQSNDEVRVVYSLKAGSAAAALRKVVTADPETGIDEEWLYIQSKQKKGWVKADSVKRS